MDRRLLRYYDLELQHLRGMGAEFAREFPKIAGRLGLEGFTCADPFVERLLEGVAFLSARVHLKLDAEFPRFTQSMLETVYPHYLAPTPSMTMLQFQPQEDEPALAQGYRIPRHTSVKSLIGKGDQTACTYRTGHEITLWPLKVLEANYYIRELASLDVPQAALAGAKSGIRIRLQTTAGLKLNQIQADSLQFYLNAPGEQQTRLYELIIGHTIGAVMQPATKPPKWRELIGNAANPPVKTVGFEDEEALLPYGPRSFQGYRLLQEYFAFPQRFYNFEVSGLKNGLKRGTENTVDLILLFNTVNLNLENMVSGANFAMHCSPAVNLFPMNADRIHITEKASDFQIIPDRTRPLDLEVHSVEKVVGIGAGNDTVVEFLPFYRARDAEEGGAYYQINRVPRVPSAKEQRFGTRTRYPGADVYLSLVDSKNAPFRSELKQLAVAVYCTNRDLALTVPIGRGPSDFTMEAGAPVTAIKSISGQPTMPRASYAEGDTAWRIISHLSLNYLSLSDARGEQSVGAGAGAGALRDLLRLYTGPMETRGSADSAEFSGIRKQVEGVKNIATKQIIRRVNKPGPISFARGLEVTVTFDEINFEGTGVFLLGAVLERFFAKYVTLNSFTETVVRTMERGEVMRWPARLGLRHTL
ncbi:MAG TPA: type VI secretion system baseplate subunit TssF [Phycisphaerae bacterium]|nr:type VI secretion system baseplate subunit TssF [Phycisphaerae bacterium]